MIPHTSLNIWARAKNSLYPLYEKRVAGEAEELDCHAQAAEIYLPYYKPGHLILDAGGGSGYFYWSLKRRSLSVYYHLLDYTSDFIEQGRKALGHENPKPVFLHESIQQAPGEYDAVFCLNTLFCLPDYRQALERLLLATKKIIIIRTTLAESNLIRFETDDYIDPGAENLKSYFNIWSMEEINSFVNAYGFQIINPKDWRTREKGEISAGKFFPWRWLVGIKA